MRFKIWHLMALTLLIAIAITLVDLSSHRTMTVQFDSPTHKPLLNLPTPPLSPDEHFPDAPIGLVPSPTHYHVHFRVRIGEQNADGWLESKFGYNSLLRKDVNPDNLSSLDGIAITIRHRYRSLPWAPATHIQDEIAKHFDELFPAWHNDLPPNYWMAAASTCMRLSLKEVQRNL